MINENDSDAVYPLTSSEYAEIGGVSCPFCGSHDIEGGFVEIVDGGAYQELSCHACGKGWNDEYELVGFIETGDE
jgi:transposase-like protein